MTDLYGSEQAMSLSLDRLIAALSESGCAHIYFKPLAPNDNSKNQPYFGSDLSVLKLFPGGELEEEIPSSRKSRLKPADRRLKSSLNFSWFGPDGRTYGAPHAKLILYPQFPEVRFSGFLRGSDADLSRWMQPEQSGREPGRHLVIGVKPDGELVGWLAVPGGTIADSLARLEGMPRAGVFFEITSLVRPVSDHRDVLITELRRIHLLGWIEGKRMLADGTTIPYASPNGAGYTLEAELGVRPSGHAVPDFLGWEIKQYGVKDFTHKVSVPLTLMTPEPSGGYYADEGAKAFVHRFGYADRHGQPNRRNFGGIYKVGKMNQGTHLGLELRGILNMDSGTFEVGGGLALVTSEGDVAALWHFSKLLDHWIRKHNRAAYVQSMKRDSLVRAYRYGNRVGLGEGTQFSHFLRALQSCTIYYDPGIKVTRTEAGESKVKRRNQLRVKTTDVPPLYESFTIIDVLDTQSGAHPA